MKQASVATTELSTSTPPAEHPIDDALVRALLLEQHPDLAALPLCLVDSGWDNVMYRLGEDLVVRLPRRRQAEPLVRHEQRWLPTMAARLPLPIPAPVRIGVPGCGYPWPWSVLPWLSGTTADLSSPASSQARPFAEFLRALHQPASSGAPPNPLRGVPLAQRAEAVEQRFSRLRQASQAVTPRLLEIWRRALAAPLAREACWLHGDLHPRNVLVEAGVIRGIIDWGDITSGDVATDLASTWMLFEDSRGRRDVLAHYGASEAQIARAKGWAVFFGAVFLDTGLVDHPRHAAIGKATLERLERDGADVAVVVEDDVAKRV